MRKHWLQDAFYFVTLGFSQKKNQKVALRNVGFICCSFIQSIALYTSV